MTEQTANQALATWAETEYETRQAWERLSQSHRIDQFTRLLHSGKRFTSFSRVE